MYLFLDLQTNGEYKWSSSCAMHVLPQKTAEKAGQICPLVIEWNRKAGQSDEFLIHNYEK